MHHLRPAIFLFLALLYSQSWVAAQVNTFKLAQGQWQHFTISSDNWHSDARFELYQIQGEPDLYVRLGAASTLNNWDFRPLIDAPTGAQFRKYAELHEVVEIDNTTDPSIASGNYVYSVYARTDTMFIINAEVQTSASEFPGMGAIAHSLGTTFRTWAPNADTVHLAASFNGFNGENIELKPEANGHWSVNVRDVGPGNQYKYVIRNGDQTLWKNDARALQLTNSVGNSVVADPDFNWTDQISRFPIGMRS